MRSVLTMLGIVFGVCSVIAMIAIGQGASVEAQRAIERLGSTNLIIETVKPTETTLGSSDSIVKSYGLTYADAESMRNVIKNLKVIVPFRDIDQQKATFQKRKCSVEIKATVPWYTETSALKILKGRFLLSNDLKNSQSVCVIDRQVARQLFTFEDPIGKYLKVKNCFYKVVGICTNHQPYNSSNSNGDIATSEGVGIGDIYIPLTTAKLRFSEYKYTYSGGTDSAEKVELNKIIVKVDGIDNVLPIYNVVKATLARLHEKDDYKIIVPLELLREAKRSKRIYSFVLGSIAAISLLVGGIGIMNIMLATVSERTREIGIRRALGAKKIDIVIQFLTETLLLTLTGGVIGVVIGVIIPVMVNRFSDMPTVITLGSLVLSFGISGAVGLGFGIYPAYRASNTDPIESLRHE